MEELNEAAQMQKYNTDHCKDVKITEIFVNTCCEDSQFKL